MVLEWNGITQSSSVSAEDAAKRNVLANAAKYFNWPQVFELLEENFEHPNLWRLNGVSFSLRCTRPRTEMHRLKSLKS